MPGSADGAAAWLADLPHLAYAAALLISRIGSAVMLIPVLGEMEVPATLRAGFTLLLVALLGPGLLDLLPAPPDSPLAAAGQVAAEIVAGLFLGWLARLAVMALTTAGSVISLATNLSSVLQPDPALGTQSAALTRMMGVLAPVVVLGSNLAALPLAALAGSYRVIAPGALLPAAATAGEIVAALGDCFALAVQLAAPFLVASLLWQLAVGLAGRLASALQPAGLLAPLQLAGALLLLALAPLGLLAAWRDHVGGVFAALPGLR